MYKFLAKYKLNNCVQINFLIEQIKTFTFYTDLWTMFLLQNLLKT